MNPLRIAVVGAGNLGRIHAKLLAQNPKVQLVAVADPVAETRVAISQSLGVPTIADFRDLIGQVDAAVIATPTRFHFDVANTLMEHGIHVLIEKPVTDSVDDARALLQSADRFGCTVQVGHVERFNPAFSAALEKIGKPKFIQANRMSTYTFRSIDIGVVYDLMIHDIDLVNSMVPGSLRETRAIGMSVFGKNEDMSQARLEFDCGAVANLTSTRCSFTPERSMQIFGTDGFAKIDFTNSRVTLIEVPSWIRNRELDFFHLTADQEAFVRETLFDNVLVKQEIEIPRSNAIADEHNDWIDAIHCQGNPKVGLGQAMESIEIAQSVLDSMASHRWEQTDVASTGPLATPPANDQQHAIPTMLQPTLPGSIRRAA